MSTFKRKFIEVFWWMATLTLAGKGILNPAASNSSYVRGPLFSKRNIETIKDQFRYGKVDCVVLGHTHKPVIMPLSFEDNGNTEKFTYVNTGYFNGLENYITSLENDDGKLVILQRYEYNPDKSPMNTKDKDWLKIHPIFDWYSKNVF